MALSGKNFDFSGPGGSLYYCDGDAKSTTACGTSGFTIRNYTYHTWLRTNSFKTGGKNVTKIRLWAHDTSATSYYGYKGILGLSSTLYNPSDYSSSIPSFTYSGQTGTNYYETYTYNTYYVDLNVNLNPNTNYYMYVGVASGGAWQAVNYNSSSRYTHYYVEFLESSTATYTITYNANGGSGGPGSATVNWGAGTLSSTKPTRTGYTFASWNTKADGSGTSYNPGDSYTATANATLYAQWTVNSYTLYVYPQGGTWNSTTNSSSFSLNYGATKSISAPTRTGYQFGGWMWSYYGAMSNSSFNQSAILSTNHGITVYDNNNSGTISLSWTDNPSTPTLFGKDYITITKVSGTASPNLGGFKRTVTPVAGTTYYHTFYAKIPVGYTLVRNNNSISGTFTWLTDQAGTGDWKIYAYKLVVDASPTNLGTFGFISLKSDTGSTTTAVTWYLGANQITKSITSAQTFTTQAGDTWMYASWIPNTYTVTYNANGGSGTTSSSTHYYDEAKTLTSNGFTRTGYTFLGWSTSSTATTATYTNAQSVSNLISTNGGSVTLYAVWEINSYTLTVNKGNNISSVSGGGTKNYNASCSISATPNTGYKFINWTGYSTSTDNPYTFNMPAGNATYTANAQGVSYTVVYHSNGGTGTMTNSSHTYGTASTLSKNAFAKTGYSFQGWSTSESSSSITYADEANASALSTTDGATINLYAVWEAKSQMFIWTTKQLDGTTGTTGRWVRVLKYVYNNLGTSFTLTVSKNSTTNSSFTYSVYSSGSANKLITDTANSKSCTIYNNQTIYLQINRTNGQAITYTLNSGAANIKTLESVASYKIYEITNPTSDLSITYTVQDNIYEL